MIPIPNSVFMVIAGDRKNGTWAIPTFVKSQAKSLESSGWRVDIGIVDDRTSFRGVKRNIYRLRQNVLDTKPALVHAQYGSVTAAIANSIRGSLPLVVSFCGDDLLGTPIPGLLWRIRERCARAIGMYAARRASTIIVKSPGLFHALPTTVREKTVILPNGVDTDFFHIMNRADCRDRLSWNKCSKIILFDASWNNQSEDRKRKNPELAQATVKLLRKSFPNLELRMISGVPQIDIPTMMNAADCLLVTSLQEGSANIIKEAMACNLPVVTVPCGDAVDRLQQTYPGGVRPYDTAELAEAINAVLLAGCRSNGREQLRLQKLTAKDVAARLIVIYQTLQGRLYPVCNELIKN